MDFVICDFRERNNLKGAEELDFKGKTKAYSKTVKIKRPSLYYKYNYYGQRGTRLSTS